MEPQIIPKTLVFDIDGTICTNTDGSYEQAVPFQERINYINRLYDNGYKIVMFTARGSTTNKEWHEFTKKQLTKWGLKFNELILKKPYGELYIDDKGIKDSDFFNEKVFNKNSIDYLLETFESLRVLSEIFYDDDQDFYLFGPINCMILPLSVAKLFIWAN